MAFFMKYYILELLYVSKRKKFAGIFDFVSLLK
jgi:hypothetical protein